MFTNSYVIDLNTAEKHKISGAVSKEYKLSITFVH